jgi:hypothetical protein
MQTELSEPAVLNWDSVIHNGIRTKNRKPLGYIGGGLGRRVDLSFVFPVQGVQNSKVTGNRV